MGKIRKQIRGTVIMGDGKTYDYDDFVRDGATIDLRDPVNREVIGDLRDSLRVLDIKEKRHGAYLAGKERKKVALSSIKDLIADA